MDAFMTSEFPRRVRSLADGAACLVIDVYREGRRTGVAETRAEVLQHIDELQAELKAGFEAARDPLLRTRLEAAYRGALPSPLIAARFGGAEHVLHQLRARLEAEEG
ncbi:MAG TPA: hypothetical protein RMH99_30705 [Sandaracinaceae bacterium LLY-WYZ-13_1]|nr:hypothetical protein [Sandaracinaceae bacterium LLY-WYZ-13_1]